MIRSWSYLIPLHRFMAAELWSETWPCKQYNRTHSMEQSPSWVSSSHSASQKNVTPLTEPGSSLTCSHESNIGSCTQLNSVHTSLPYFCKIYSNNVTISTPRSFLQVFSTTTLYALFISFACYVPHQCYIPSRSSLRSVLHSPVTSSLWGPNILLSTLFS